MFNPLAVIIVICLYIGVLFLIALWVERKASQGRNIGNHPVIYSLSLAVYCTTWTYYGSVGYAAASGMLFLTIYLGPTLAMLLCQTMLRKMIHIKNAYRITSIADFLSVRYDKSLGIAALVTIIAFFGIIPYIALQLKAVISTFDLLIKPASSGISSWTGIGAGPLVVLLMIIFTIIFGVRRLDPTERHQGMIVALAIECTVKLIALLVVGVFVTYFVFNGFSDIFQRFSESPFSVSVGSEKTIGPSYVTWTTYLVLAMSAFLFLPRQFHVGVIENFDEKHIKTAMWLFPLYLLLLNVFIVPIAQAGLLLGVPIQQTDTFVLDIPMHMGRQWLSLLVFIGGFSAATGMIMISSMTMSTMLTNHLVLPLVANVGRLAFLRRRLLQCRWVVVAAYITAGYWFERTVGDSFMLVDLGMISFVAVLQFAPAVLGGILWRQGNKRGALLGLGSGFLLWFYTLVLPAFATGGWLSKDLVGKGPWGISFLRPEQLFGLNGLDPFSHAVFWTMAFNVGLYVLGSLYFEQTKTEQGLSKEFVQALTPIPAPLRPVSREAFIDLARKKQELVQLLSQYFPVAKASEMVEQCIAYFKLEDRSRITIVDLIEILKEVEKRLAGSIGAAAAHMTMQKGVVFTPREEQELSRTYIELLADYRLTPSELKDKIDYYKERDALLTRQATELEQRVEERTSQLREKTTELERSNKELEYFAFVASHDLKEPLVFIGGFAELLQERYADKLDAKGRGFLSRIIDGTIRMKLLIDGLLAYARVTTHARPFQSVDCNAALRAALANLTARIKESNAVITSDDLPTVTGDEIQLMQLFQNLIGNAIKYRSDKPPRIHVSAKNISDFEIRNAEPKSEKIASHSAIQNPQSPIEKGRLFFVSDNGIGIDPLYFEQIFKTFLRLHEDEKKYPGTGIGLAVCKKIVERHHGRIWVESEPGKGSTFYFTIP